MSAKRLASRDGEHEGFKAYALDGEADLEALQREFPDGFILERTLDSGPVLWISGDLEPNSVRGAVRRASSTPQEVEAPDDGAEVERLRAKVSSGDNLTPNEIQTALRLLLTKGA